MSDLPLNSEADLTRGQLDQSHANEYETAVEAKKNTKVKHRIDQAERLSAPHQLPAFQDLQRLSNAIEDEEADFKKFCETVGEVPQVKNLIFRDARSILAGRGSRIETIRHAVAMLGVRRIRGMLAQLSEPYEDLMAEELAAEEHEFCKDKVVRISA